MSAKKKAGKAAGRKITPKPPGPRVPDEIKTKRDSKPFKPADFVISKPVKS